ncbi:MAG: metal-dependent hydrolase [Myxococcota bacterium]|nr:metal-dependent hydrolase [Myxococcota bacterium]
MASWKGHLSFGALCGVAYSASVAYRGSDLWPFVPAFVGTVVLGALLPDLDSDTSKPVKILFRAFSIIASVAVGLALYLLQFPAIHYVTTGPFITLMAVQLIILPLFNRLSSHRGMFHSLPAAAISGLLCWRILRYLSLATEPTFFLALGIAVGYLSHLVLDQLWGKVTFSGAVFSPSNKQGGPLKLYSKNILPNGLTYLLLLVLIWQNIDQIEAIFLTEGFVK